MPEFTPIQEELLALLERACEDELSETESARLEEIVLTDSDARWLYVQYQSIHALLPRYNGAGFHLPSLHHLRGALETPSRPEPQPSPLLKFLRPTQRLLPWPAGTSFTTAALLLGLVLAILWWKRAPNPVAPDAPQIVRAPIATPETAAATVFAVQGARWALGETALMPGYKLTAGSRLKLDAGLVTLDFQQGARVLLEGPAELKIESASRAHLENGRLTALVSLPARGFVLQTPAARIVDLGTEFGVASLSDRTTEVHVFQGSVEVEYFPAGDRASAKYQIGERMAMRLSPAENATEQIALDAEDFQRLEQPGELLLVTPVAVQASSELEAARAASQCINGSGLSGFLSSVRPAPRLFPAHDTNYQHMWLSTVADSSAGPELCFDLGQTRLVKGFHYWNHNEAAALDRGIKQVEIQASESEAGEDFVIVADFELKLAPGVVNYRGETLKWKTPVSARRVKLRVLSNGGNAYTGLAEMVFLVEKPEFDSPEQASEAK